MKDDDLLQNLIIDLRRGTLVLAVLSCLKKTKYGYALLQDMVNQGIYIEANTLYPLLRRLETQGLLKSEWDTGESRPRKYYTLSKKGKTLHEMLKEEWFKMTLEMEKFLKEKDEEEDETIN